MRIAFLTTEFITEPDSYDGGLSNYIYKVSIGLLKFGHQPIVIISSNENSYFKYKDIEVYRVKPQQNFLYKLADKVSRYKYQPILDLLLQSFYVNKKLNQINKEKSLDIVQFPSYQAIGYFVSNKTKSVMRISGYQKIADPANGIYHKTIRQRQRQILENRSYKKAKNIFGPSYFLANIIAMEFNKPVEVIESPNEKKEINLDSSIIKEIEGKINGKKFGLFFGRLAQIKGLLDVAEILDEFLTKHPSHYFVIIGKDMGYKGSTSLNYILEKVGKHEDRLIYYKEQHHEKLMPVIQKADFILMPSRIENFPNACVEAMSFKKIVIAPRGISFEQLIEDGVSGFLCENANPTDLLSVIEKVVNLPVEKKKEIELNAGETIKRLHPDITIKKLIDYYQSILKK
jgi:glycosyltransferase involved in cell wall biosynthesis